MSGYVNEYANDLLNEIIELRKVLNNQLDKYNTVSFEDYVEYNLLIQRLEDKYHELENEIIIHKEKIEFSNYDKEESKNLLTILKIYNYKLESLKLALLFYGYRAHLMENSKNAYLEYSKGGN